MKNELKFGFGSFFLMDKKYPPEGIFPFVLFEDVSDYEVDNGECQYTDDQTDNTI